jgi:hypothetical protein
MSIWKRISLTGLSLLVLGLAPIGAALAQIKVTAATPSSAVQGTVSLDVVVSGSGFDNSAKVQYFVSGTTNPGGITVRKVVFRHSKELVTTIDVADTADLASFDIVVTLDSGRKGKGTTLFLVKPKPTGPSAAPTYPPARKRHAFTSNGGTTAAASRLYMFGGTSDGGESDLDDLWSYASAGSTGASWTFIPGGTSSPSQRDLMGWSCGGGQCVMVNGFRYASWVKETWIFNESTQAWSQASCGRRVLCPSYRAGPTMAYDPPHGIHVLFGGQGDGDPMLLADTLLFNAVTRTWTQVNGGVAPPARVAAAAAYAPGVGVVMSGGGGNPCCDTTLNDVHVWNGTSWTPVATTVISDPPRAVPSLWGHSMAWDATRNAMVVTGGFTTSWHTPNEETWYVTFSNSSGAWRATWTLAIGIGCQAAVSSPPDPVVHPGARMAYDPVAHVQVFFGGEADQGASSYGNTVECQ